MIQGKRITFIILCLLLICVGLIYFSLQDQAVFLPDTVAMNRVSKEAGLHWPNVAAGDYGDYGQHFVVTTLDGEVIYPTNSDVSTTPLESAKHLDHLLTVTSQGRVVGLIQFKTDILEQIRLHNQQKSLLLAVTIFIMTILSVGYYMYLNRIIVRPFNRLQDFAKRISNGNLDIPLQMDKYNLFGAFTEAFDILRTQLALSREKEHLSAQSKKELVASLSHDIKTPVTSIKLLSELMLATEKETQTVERLHTIYDKAEQIDKLISDMFQTALEELGELPIHLAELRSDVLFKVIRDADYYEKTSCSSIPHCLIVADETRLEQVIGNIIMNSYKYANTPIQVNFSLQNQFLNVVIQDYGKGVEEEELIHLTNKFYRGKNALTQKQSGSGLGLYISAHIMEKMGGNLRCYNYSDGFAVELMFPLA